MKSVRFVKGAASVLLAAGLLFSFAGCGEKKEEQKSSVASVPVSVAPKGNLNPLTGLYNLPDEAVGKRPVSFMINNIKIALPQYGIGQADIIFEALAEGGITRLMAVFSDYQKLPKQVGPVRSARDYYLDFAAPMDTIFVNWGTSSIAATTIRDRQTDNIDGMYYSDYFYTDMKLANAKGWEHSRFMKPEGFAKVLKRTEERLDSQAEGTAFAFRDPDNSFVPAERSVSYLQAKFSYSYDAAFTYAPKTKQYLVSEFGDPHMDNVTKKQLSFDNVLVLYTTVTRIGTNDGKIAVGLESGEGFYATRGGGMTINWKKGNYKNNFSFTDQTGKAVQLNAGTTYVCIIPTTEQDATVIKGAETSSAGTSTSKS